MDEILLLYKDLHDFLGTNEICAEFSKEIIQVIQNAIDAIPADARVAIRCADQCAEYLMGAVDFSRTNVVGIFDLKREEGAFCGYPLFCAEKLYNIQCDVVISATYIFRDAVKLELEKFKGRKIDIYDLLEEHGIILREGLHHYKLYQPMVLNYFYRNYLQNRSGDLEEASLRNFLQAAVEYKDFVMIDRVFQENGGLSGRYPFLIDAWKKMRHLLDAIQNKVMSRKYRDIFGFWTDAINDRDLKNMPNLRRMCKNGLYFENTYTNTPWTRPVLQAIFQKLLPIDGFPDTHNAIQIKNSPLIQYLEQQGYVFRWVSFPIWAMDPEYVVKGIDEKMASSIIWWHGMQSLLQTEKPCFYIFHFLTEGHEPMISPDWIDDFNYLPSDPHTRTDDAMKRRKTTLGYLDQGLSLCNQILGDKVQIYFSDHGRYWSDIPEWSEERLHTYCAVLGNGIPRERLSAFFQYTDFENLIRWIIEPETNSFHQIFSNEIKFQDVDYYKEVIVNAAIDSNRDGLSRNGIAFRGVRTGNCKYVLNALGEEYYYMINEDGTETLTPLEDDALRAELQSKCGTYFIDIRKYDKFKHSRKLYESILRDYPELGKPLWLTEESGSALS